MTAAPQPPTPLGAMDRYRVWAPSAGAVEIRVDGTVHTMAPAGERSEERRVGKECRSRWSPYH